MTECLPWWIAPTVVLLSVVMWTVGYRQGQKSAYDTGLTRMTLDWINFKAKLGERYMAEKDRARGEDA